MAAWEKILENFSGKSNKLNKGVHKQHIPLADRPTRCKGTHKVWRKQDKQVRRDRESVEMGPWNAIWCLTGQGVRLGHSTILGELETEAPTSMKLWAGTQHDPRQNVGPEKDLQCLACAFLMEWQPYAAAEPSTRAAILERTEIVVCIALTVRQR